MRMTFRWYGENNDSVTLEQIKQIPGVEGLVWALHDKVAGEVWPLEDIMKVKEQADRYGFHLDVVESINVHEEIKLGLPTRDAYIENYKESIRNVAKVGAKVICYNFMPVFDWTRTDLFKEMEDGATALFYEKAKVDNMDPHELVRQTTSNAAFTMPGWEPERLAHIEKSLKAYENVTEDALWEHLQYFLEQVLPVAEEHDIQMAIHPDDPPWSVFGLPRIITSEAAVERFLQLSNSPAHGITLCSGSLGANPENDIPKIIRRFHDRIPFAHIRNVKIYENGDFIETSHRSQDGSVNIADVVKAYHENGFTGYVRPDHGRHIWNEKCRPGYGLYDRALGIMHLWGLWDAYELEAKRRQL
ncbi:mannonate dehydratase [Shouchella clausii]|uniref:Mannonate dehydratase n=1 Tax=Shouchella clausii TaxID=79880 RepID=A0A268S110_SHOCL|nr:mannonate dehydratase [Shouchella clausii]PAD44451.1 mannonate dehydratase [Bacillus sp. 7520-S]MBU8596131.1 mannonate dehydratase [Shouchella clausii]MCY1102915.1 mannonate dehydratase [Shouchella clausii]MED4159768.1 mannonate dehydratase [Shouchella clausii]MED4177820.1 mannonate dehydratase [Shouchella clausii]